MSLATSGYYPMFSTALFFVCFLDVMAVRKVMGGKC